MRLHTALWLHPFRLHTCRLRWRPRNAPGVNQGLHRSSAAWSATGENRQKEDDHVDTQQNNLGCHSSGKLILIVPLTQLLTVFRWSVVPTNSGARCKEYVHDVGQQRP